MMRNRIINAGVRQLRDFGYPSCNAANIMTDTVFKEFFKTMLEGTFADAPEGGPLSVACKSLLDELKNGPR